MAPEGAPEVSSDRYLACQHKYLKTGKETYGMVIPPGRSEARGAEGRPAAILILVGAAWADPPAALGTVPLGAAAEAEGAVKEVPAETC